MKEGIQRIKRKKMLQNQKKTICFERKKYFEYDNDDYVDIRNALGKKLDVKTFGECFA